jgi:hypothetical protein
LPLAFHDLDGTQNFLLKRLEFIQADTGTHTRSIVPISAGKRQRTRRGSVFSLQREN